MLFGAFIAIMVIVTNFTMLVRTMHGDGDQYGEELWADDISYPITNKRVLVTRQSTDDVPWEVIHDDNNVDTADGPTTYSSLPRFADDNSEYALGAIIERVSDSFDLFTTVFLLSHSIPLRQFSYPGNTPTKGATVVQPWKKLISKFQTTVYHPNGVRKSTSKISCKISHGVGGAFYMVEGEFVPRDQFTNFEGDVPLDILRCKMQDTEKAYLNLARSGESAHIEIFRGSASVMRFEIPWRSRRAGYMLSEPPDHSLSTFDAWKGFNNGTPGVWTHDKIHLCASGWNYEPTKTTLPSLLEFLQHHILQGVDHIFTTSMFKWQSPRSQLLERVMSSFIEDGHLSLNTHAGHGMDGLYL
jgi:hypothetical protein